MRVKFKDPKAFKRMVIISGYTFAVLASKCNKSAASLLHATKNNAISPEFAKALCDFFKKKFDDLFIIVGE